MAVVTGAGGRPGPGGLTEHRLRIGDRGVVLLEGPEGWGEISPLPGYPCDPAAARRAAEEAAGEGWPAARRHRLPVNALLDDDASGAEATAARAAAMAAAGFPCLKLKVGRGDPDHDVERVAAARGAVGPSVALRADANGAWDLETAVRTIGRMERYGLELVEQPVASLPDLALVRRRVGVPVAADEAVRGPLDARRVRELAAADAVVLKVQPLGGVRAALAVADEAGTPALVTSMMETSVGLAAGAALAAALPALPFASGLATLDHLAGDVTTEPLRPVDGSLDVRPVVPSPDLLARYAERAVPYRR